MPSHQPTTPPPQLPPPLKHIRSNTAEALDYWRQVLDHCTHDSLHLRAPSPGTRDVFTLPSLIIKSSHLKTTGAMNAAFSDRNEVAALEKLKEVGLGKDGIKVPEIYFAGELDGHQVLVQERLPGVPLDIKWPDLTHEQLLKLRAQIRKFMRKIHAIKPPEGTEHPQYLYPDPDVIQHRGLQKLEKMLLLDGNDTEWGMVHNDMQTTNILVDEKGERVVGVVDWEMAGWFGWNRAAEVHKRIRTPAVGGGVAEGMAVGEGLGAPGEGAEGEIWGALYDCGLEGDVEK